MKKYFDCDYFSEIEKGKSYKTMDISTCNSLITLLQTNYRRVVSIIIWLFRNSLNCIDFQKIHCEDLIYTHPCWTMKKITTKTFFFPKYTSSRTKNPEFWCIYLNFIMFEPSTSYTAYQVIADNIINDPVVCHEMIWSTLKCFKLLL